MSNSPIKIKASLFSESVSTKTKSEAELQREKNIQERDAFLASFMNDPEFAEAVESIGLFDNENKTKTSGAPKCKIKKRHDKTDDSTFKYFGNVPIERRTSLRLQDKDPVFTKDDLVDESSFKRKRYTDTDYTDLEDVVYRPKKTRVRTKHERPAVIPVCDVTEEMISKIARKVSVKLYSEMGTSCHQCRQKTLDQKTCCRNSECFGVRGQFCGVCLENRYGENAAEALRDSNWNCPVCRGICNCSFCRTKAGKRPTGILTPLAHQAGHKSVKEFLESLKGEGDYIHEHQDPRNLLGFTTGLDYAQMGGRIKHFLNYHKNIQEKLMKCIQKLEKDLETLKKANEPVLLGFHENQPVYSNSTQF